jgi:hypothetical protein
VTPIGFQLLEKKHALLDKPPFLALKRCVKDIITIISCYTRNFSLHFIKKVRGINPEPTSDDLTKPLGWVLHSRHCRRIMGHYG